MSEKLNIIFAGGFSYPDGYAGTQLVQTAIDYFHQHAHPVKVLSWGASHSAINCSQGEYKGVPYTILPLKGLRGLNATVSGVKFLIRARSSKSRNVIIVYGVPEPKSVILLFVAKVLGFKVVHWVVEDFSVYDLKNSEKGVSHLKVISHRFFSRIIKIFADGVIVLSMWLERKYKKQGVQTALVPISTGRLSIKPRAAESIRRNVIVYAGTFGQKDGVEDLIESFIGVRKNNPSAILELVGSGARRSELEKRYGDVPGVSFLGYLDDEQYETTLSTADVLCMTRVCTPYANAGFPYKVGDYLAMGRPVLATRVSDIERYLTDGESAVLVESGDQAQMSNALEYLLNNHNEADQIGAKGRIVCEKNFNPEINGARIELFVRSL